MRKLNAKLILLDDILIMTSTTKICVTSMPDFTDSRCEKKISRMNALIPQETKDKIISQCQVILKRKLLSVSELTRVLGRLSSTAIPVLAAALQYRAIQR